MSYERFLVGCSKDNCPSYDGGMCTNDFGCNCYEIDLLNYKVGNLLKEENETNKGTN